MAASTMDMSRCTWKKTMATTYSLQNKNAASNGLHMISTVWPPHLPRRSFILINPLDCVGWRKRKNSNPGKEIDTIHWKNAALPSFLLIITRIAAIRLVWEVAALLELSSLFRTGPLPVAKLEVKVFWLHGRKFLQKTLLLHAARSTFRTSCRRAAKIQEVANDRHRGQEKLVQLIKSKQISIVFASPFQTHTPTFVHRSLWCSASPTSYCTTNTLWSDCGNISSATLMRLAWNAECIVRSYSDLS